MKSIQNFVTFALARFRAQTIRKMQADTAADFVGCEVLEREPGGAYSVAVITEIEWDKSVLPVGWQKGQPGGDWCIKVRYIATGWEGWTSQDALTLTGTKYDDAGAAIIQHAHNVQMQMEMNHE